MRVSVFKSLHPRLYATEAALKPHKPSPRDPTRPYESRKAYLYQQYTELLGESQVLLLLRHTNFSVGGLNKVRRDIINSGSGKGKDGIPVDGHAKPVFEVIRPGIFGAALRARLSSSTIESVTPLLAGQVALLSLPHLNPIQLSALIRVIERAAPPRLQSAQQSTPQKPPENDYDEAPPAIPDPPSITLLGAIIEDRAFMVDGLKEVGRLPTLDSLRAQIVGLLSSPAAQILRTLQSASGSDVLRTLEGFKKGLEDETAQ
jgi:ribosomal protein L10